MIKNILGVLLFLITYIAIPFCWYRLGKHDADRWYAKHPIEISVHCKTESINTLSLPDNREINKRNILMDAELIFINDGINWFGDCSNQNIVEWVKNHYAERRKELLDRSIALKRIK